MKILYSPESEPMLIDTVDGLNELHKKLSEFLGSEETTKKYQADVSGNPKPYKEFLVYLEICKNDGPNRLSLTMERGLFLEGSKENLYKYISHFKFEQDEDGEHHHPDNSLEEKYMARDTMGLIISADDYYINVYQYEN